MNYKVRELFYKDVDGRKEFFKPYIIRVIRNRIIDPNTQNFLADGFLYFDKKSNTSVTIPCDDSNWCEYMTFDQGIKMGVINFPFSLKLHNDYFKRIENYEEFEEILKLVIDFRINTIKKGWAIKYGFSFQEKDYPELESLGEFELINWKDPRSHARFSFDDIKPEELLG